MLTDKPFGVNVMLLSPFADDVACIAPSEKSACGRYDGAGNPGKYMDMWKGVDIKGDPSRGFRRAGQSAWNARARTPDCRRL